MMYEIPNTPRHMNPVDNLRIFAYANSAIFKFNRRPISKEENLLLNQAFMGLRSIGGRHDVNLSVLTGMRKYLRIAAKPDVLLRSGAQRRA
jgi:hypothetical protein